MSSDLLDDWDEYFLEQAIKIEENYAAAATTTNTSLSHPLTTTTSSLPQIGQQQQPFAPRNLPPPPSSCGGVVPAPSSHAYSSRIRAGKDHHQSLGGPRNVGSHGFVGGLGEDCGGAGFSPPRELSQRFPEKKPETRTTVRVSDNFIDIDRIFGSRTGRKDKEIEGPKVNECTEIKNGTAKMDAQLKVASSKVEAKDAEIGILKTANLDAYKPDHFHTPLQFVDLNISTGRASAYPTSEDKCTWIDEQARECFRNSKRKGGPVDGQLSNDERLKCSNATKMEAQDNGSSAVSELKHQVNGTTTSIGCVNQNLTKAIGIQTDSDVDYCSIVEERLSLHHVVSRDLLAFWGSPVNRRSGRNLVSKLFLTCSEDFTALLDCSGRSSEVELKYLSVLSSFDTKLDLHVHSVQSDAAAKLSQLYTVLAKISKEMVEMHILLDVLVSLCMIDNDLIVYKSLHILRVVLQIAFNYEMRSYKRVLTVYSHSNDNIIEEKYNNESLHKNEGIGDGLYISMDCCTSLIETMQRIALKSNAEHIRKEALSIMNLIVMESDPISERERFGLILSESFSKFLCKEVGVDVRKQALQLLFLLLNCPKLMLTFCNQHKDETNRAETSEGQVKNVILKGLSECVLCGGKSIPEHKVQRKAVIVLAFIASSGQPGFEILLNPVTLQGANFLELIIQILALEIDADAAGFDKSQELVNERILLMREALILLNRLASNACYSKAVLGVLTRSAASTSLTIDAANKISRRSRECRKYDSTSKIPVMEAETIDLARSIRARVLSFLGENVS